MLRSDPLFPPPMSRRRLAFAALTLAATLVLPATASAQLPAAQQSVPLVLERIVRDRWLHDGQQPGLVTFDSVRNSIHVRSRRSVAPGDGRMLTLQIQNLGALLFLDAQNRSGSRTVDRPPIRYSGYEDERAREETRRRTLRGAGALQNLPETRFWEVPFVLPAIPLVAGVMWTDTLSFRADPGEGLWETLEGVWHNVVVGDTLIDGRSLPLVRTTAEVRYRSRELHADNALAVSIEIERDAAGTIAGSAAVDTMAGVRAAGVDTTQLAGMAVLRTGDGRAFDAPVRYERHQRWMLRDSVAWAVVQDSQRAERLRQSTGMLTLPRTPLEERLRAGDAALIDSLLTVWRGTQDPNLRHDIRMSVLRARAEPARAAFEEQLVALRRAAGDSAGIIAEEIQNLHGQRITPDRLAQVLPYLDDPGRLWQLGALPRFVYLEMSEHITRSSPILEPDPARWWCDPAACAMVLALLDTAAEPRLRDIALAGAFAREPARWYDRLVARADSGSLIAHNAVRRGQGVGATFPAAPHLPMPEPDAAWQTWLVWLGGRVRWGQSHADAMRLFTARTERDPVQELLAVWPPAEDSARLVIGTILAGMNALAEPSAAELAALFISGSAADVSRARTALFERFNAEATAAGAATASELLQPLIDSVAAARDSPWPAASAHAPGVTGRIIHPSTLGYHGVRDVPVFVLVDNLPPEIIAALPSPFEPITRAEWDARPARQGGVIITFSPVRQWDAFVDVGFSWTALQRRTPDQAPSGYGGGASLILLRTPAGWRVVTVSGWIT